MPGWVGDRVAIEPAGGVSPLRGGVSVQILGYRQGAVNSYRKTYRFLTIGFSYKVAVVLTRNSLQSGRGVPYKVAVNKSMNTQAYPQSIALSASQG